MTTPAQGPAVSPDGLWWWDGSQWRPTGVQRSAPQWPVPPAYYYVSRPTNGLAIASMILGVLVLDGVGSVLALIFGIVALRQIRRRGEGGRGMAIAGVVLGSVGVVLVVAAIIVIVCVALAGGFHSGGGSTVVPT